MKNWEEYFQEYCEAHQGTDIWTDHQSRSAFIKEKFSGQRFVGDREEWHSNGRYHREDGPAVIWRGKQAWYLDGKYLKIVPQHILVNYMKRKELTAAHLLTDPDPIIRTSAANYKWD